MKSKNFISRLIFVFLILILISDFYYKYNNYNEIQGLRMTLFVKIIIGALLVFVGAKNKLYKKTNIYLIVGLLVISMLSFLHLCSDDFLFTAESLGKYFFGLIVFLFFINQLDSINSHHLDSFLAGLIILNFVFIVLGYIFDFQIFRTYQGSRFGFDGIFKSTSVASYFYILCISNYVLKNRKPFDVFILLITLISAIFVGSKSIYGFIAFALLAKFLLYIYKKQNFVSAKTYFVGVSILIISFVSLFLKEIISLHSKSREVMENSGLFSAVFSYRDIHLNNAFVDIQNNFEFGNLIYGGLSCVRRYTEIAIADLFITFGLVGATIYIFIFYYNIPKIKDCYTTMLFFGILAIIFLRGNFFYFPSVIYVSIIIFVNILNIKKHE